MTYMCVWTYDMKDTGSDGNLMPCKMLEVLFPDS